MKITTTMAWQSMKTADELAAFLQKAADAYYNLGEPLLSDDEYDLAIDHLRKLDPKHPFLKHIGAPIAAGVTKVKLPYWMGSLDKIRDDPKQLQKWKTTYPGDVVVSDKLDGNSAMLVFDGHGKVAMYSRGDGETGQDLSHLIPHIQGIPTMPAKTAVRGELILSKKNWKLLAHKGANARNVVAGALHAVKKLDLDIAKKIEFVAYELLTPKMIPSESLVFLRDHGFRVVESMVLRDDQVTMDILSEKLMKRRDESSYEIDGIVVAHNQEHRLMSGKNPKYAFAFKTMLTHEEAEVIVREIEWNVSKDGYIKPTILFAPVSLNGVQIQRATGFNAAFIETNVIGPGARVMIVRSGDVIPHIIRVTQRAPQGPSMPMNIPYEWNETHVDIIATNADSKEQRQKMLEHFAKTLDIAYVAAGTLKKLVEAGFDTIPKLLRITKADVLRIEGFQETSAARIASALQEVREKVTCLDLMVASNIYGRGLGAKKLKLILEQLPFIYERRVPTVTEVQQIEGIGPVTAKAFVEGMPKFFALLDEIGIPCRGAPAALRSGPSGPPSFEGVQVVFTGFRSKEWETIIENQGGKVTTSVSKKTTYVVAADPAEKSGKIEKAHELGVPVLAKDAFAKKYGFAT